MQDDTLFPKLRNFSLFLSWSIRMSLNPRKTLSLASGLLFLFFLVFNFPFLCFFTKPPFSVFKSSWVSLWMGTRYNAWHTEWWTRLWSYDSPLSRVFRARLRDMFLSFWASVPFLLGFLFSYFFVVSQTTPPISVFKSVCVSLWMGTSNNPWQTISLASCLLFLFSWFSFFFFFCCVQDHTSHFCFQVFLGVPMNGN